MHFVLSFLLKWKEQRTAASKVEKHTKTAFGKHVVRSDRSGPCGLDHQQVRASCLASRMLAWGMLPHKVLFTRVSWDFLGGCELNLPFEEKI